MGCLCSKLDMMNESFVYVPESQKYHYSKGTQLTNPNPSNQTVVSNNYFKQYIRPQFEQHAYTKI